MAHHGRVLADIVKQFGTQGTHQALLREAPGVMVRQVTQVPARQEQGDYAFLIVGGGIAGNPQLAALLHIG